MKCQNNVDGRICGEEIPQSSKFCLACGGKVAKEDDTTTKACPQCSSLITKREKFCAECGWRIMRIDPAIFLAPKILCAGKDDDGDTCGAELIPGKKFCPECGSDQVKLNEQDKENTKDTGSQLPASALNEPLESPVSDLAKNHEQSEAMETDDTQTGTSQPVGSTEGNTDKDQEWKNAPLPDTSISEEEEDEEEGETKSEQSTKPMSKKGQNARKKKQPEQKERKKRKQEMEKENTDGTPEKQGKTDNKTKPTPTPDTGRQEEKMEQNTGKMQTRTMDKEAKSQSNNASASGKGEASSSNGATGTQTSGQSYAAAAASNVGSGQGANQRNKKFSDIHFHCVVAPPMFTSLEKDKLYVIFEDSSLGGWNGRKYLMKGIRTLPDNSVEFSGVVSIPNYILFSGAYGGRVNYNYCIVHSDGQQITHEFVGTFSGNGLFRSLRIKNTDLVKGVYHRYDGVVREHPTKNKTALQKIYKYGKEFIGYDDYKKVLIKDAEVAVKIFQPRWQITSFSADGVNGEELINHIKFVVDGLKEIYCNQASVWYSSDFDKVVSAVVYIVAKTIPFG